MPWAINPLPAIDLGQANPWFVDWRLAAIKHNPDLCRRVLVAPHIEAQPIADSPMRDGCGWVNGVRMSTAGGVRAGFDKLTCEAAVALALWLEHDLQEVAQEHLRPARRRGAELRHLLVPQHHRQPALEGLAQPARHRQRRRHRRLHARRRAAHLRARALARHGPEARFLRAAHARACRYFRVALGPDYNAAHHDHFHFDRGPLLRCK